MADDETVSGIPVLSAFDKLKLSSSNNNFIINRNSNVSLSTRSQIDNKNSHSPSSSSSVVKVTSAASVLAAAAAAASETSAAMPATESSNCEKSMGLLPPPPLTQFECNNKKTIMMYGSSEMNTTTLTSSSGAGGGEKKRASGYSTFAPPLSPHTAHSPTKIEKTIQFLCGSSDNQTNSATPTTTTTPPPPPQQQLPPLMPSLSITSHSSLSLTSLSSSTSIASPSSSLATITMVLPNSVNGGKNFDMFSSSAVQSNLKKFDSNEVSIKMLNKSAKCNKTSVPVPVSSAGVSAPVSASPVVRQLKPIASKSAPIICAPPPMVLPIQANKFTNNSASASAKKSNSRGKNQNFGFPMLPGKLSTMTATKQQSSNVDNKKRQLADKNEQDTTIDDRNKKKRCSDRYDSSESSDSGVATSLSCTDSSTASSDASDPGSPYSPVLLGDELPHKSNMPPQTILATTNGTAAKSPTTGAATPVQNVLKGGKQQQKHSQNKCITPQHPQKYGKAQISTQKITHHIWPWTSMGAEMSAGSTTAKSNTNKSNNKRHSQVSSVPTDGGAKKTRTTNGNNMDAVAINGAALQPPQIASNGKRLKAAAMEESQTKITGYFKSQMKAQIHQNGLKKDTMAHILPSTSSPSVTVTTVVPSSTSPSSNSILSTTTSTSSSLNKYFNLLTSQLREDQERACNNPTPILPSLPPALKKIERSKPTKIAQVAPNLRKTTASTPLSAQMIEKSPPKKHVPIAPRTADTRPKHEQLMPSPMKAPPPPSQQQQPAVLLTAIRIPQSNQPPQLVPTSPQQQVANGNCSKAQQNNAASAAACASKVPTGPSLYQIPMMPNLVQFPNLIAANVSQLTAARGNHHHPAATAQYFLNGTVFKLQQFTAPPTGTNSSFSMENGNQSVNTASVTTTANAIEQHASNTKNTSSITATSLQEMLSNQFQTQQQHQQQQQSVTAAHNVAHRLHHSQPVFMATTAGLLLNAASLPAMLGPNKQAMAIQSQQIPALQPIQGASAMMPALSSIFGSHQEVSTQHLQQYKSEQVAGLTDSQTSSLQPNAHIPPLSVSSSAFSKLAIVKAGATFTPSVHQVSATQPPPLVTISSGSQNVIVSNKPYQMKSTQQESTAKSKKNNECTPVFLPPSIVAPIATAQPPPSTSPPALAYPSLIAQKEVQKRTEDLFDLLKNSKNEPTLTPPPTLYIPEEKVSEEPLNIEISSSESPSNTSTICDESTKPVDSPSHDTSSPVDASLASTSLISAESPSLIIDFKQHEATDTSSFNISETSSTESILATLMPTVVDTSLADNGNLPKSAISPILSQPKTIRFPAKKEYGSRFGPKGMRRHDGVCYWDKCNKKHESSSKLLDHMQAHHVNTQTGPFACLWLGCKVYGRESCSRRWLERHVLSHGGTKPFKCIVDGCGFRFGSQLALQKHVNGHFTATENKDSTNKRTSDPPVPKLLRKNGKKLRYRRQPFSARMFDFFDTGIMEGLQHRLRQISTLTNGNNSITFQGEIIMRRKNLKGIVECYVQWAPPKIISNEWLPESTEPYIKTLPINRMQPNEKTNVESLLNSAYRLPHSPNLFQSFHSLSRQNSQDSSATSSLQDNSQSMSITDETSSSDRTSRSSSIGIPSISSISELPSKLPQMELRQKQSRKPPKRIQPS